MFQKDLDWSIVRNKGSHSLSRIGFGLIFFIAISGLIGHSQVQAGERSAPGLVAYPLEENPLSSEVSEGDPALLVFWAPWCGVCRRELPKVAKFYESEKPDTLEVLSIGGSDTEENVQEFVDDNPDVFVFPTTYDEDSFLAALYRIKAFPTYVLLDEEGGLVFYHRGGGLLNTSKFRNYISSLP